MWLCICAAGVIVATIEKAHMLVDRLLSEKGLGRLSCVVVDELHMVGDEDRGYLLELMLNKLRWVRVKGSRFRVLLLLVMVVD
jgi:replicative superfamily II helicase